ncbi:MAG: hypothetical protein JWO86_739, partial [Myxococcaceae bacterium]|nr:hypothetical protein [Myxococcaceae bacterium]
PKQSGGVKPPVGTRHVVQSKAEGPAKKNAPQPSTEGARTAASRRSRR